MIFTRKEVELIIRAILYYYKDDEKINSLCKLFVGNELPGQNVWEEIVSTGNPLFNSDMLYDYCEHNVTYYNKFIFDDICDISMALMWFYCFCADKKLKFLADVESLMDRFKFEIIKSV